MSRTSRGFTGRGLPAADASRVPPGQYLTMKSRTDLDRLPRRVVVLALDGVYLFELGIPDRIFAAVEGA